MNNLEKSIFEKKEDRVIIIKRSSEAPKNVKENPFYNEETWGRALSPDDIYLPDSDEALSFAIAAHEIGHLSNEDEIDKKEITLYNFEGCKKEEERAWRVGKKYTGECIDEYYKDDEEIKQKIEKAIDEVEKLMMEQVDLSKDMYLEEKPQKDLGKDEYEKLLKQKREELFSSKKGDQIMEKEEEKKEQKIGIKPDWDKFSGLIKEAVKKILEDNKKE